MCVHVCVCACVCARACVCACVCVKLVHCHHAPTPPTTATWVQSYTLIHGLRLVDLVPNHRTLIRCQISGKPPNKRGCTNCGPVNCASHESFLSFFLFLNFFLLMFFGGAFLALRLTCSHCLTGFRIIYHSHTAHRPWCLYSPLFRILHCRLEVPHFVFFKLSYFLIIVPYISFNSHSSPQSQRDVY